MKQLHFDQRTRDNGEVFYSTDDEFTQDLIQSIHFDHFGGCWPSDWVYEIARDVYNSLGDYDDPDEDTASELADQLCDTSYHSLYTWLATFSPADDMVSEAVNEGLLDPQTLKTEGLWKVIQIGQYTAIERIARSIIEAVCVEDGDDRPDNNLLGYESMKSLYKELKDKGLVIGTYYRDVDIPATNETREILKRHQLRIDNWMVQEFRNQITGLMNYRIMGGLAT